MTWCAPTYTEVRRGTRQAFEVMSTSPYFWRKRPPPTLDGIGLDLGAEIEKQIGKPVDLVHRILRDGILLYEGDPSARIRFEVRARGEYFDLLPYLRQYRRSNRGHQA